MMSGIRGRNTKPELDIRKALHRRGFRYALHSKHVPGKPDIVFPSRKAVIFVHGCFWHGHDCSLYRVPETRREFWLAKIASNRKRDAKVGDLIRQAGWRKLVVWECAMRGKGSKPVDVIADLAATWLRSAHKDKEIRGG
jgi:DNA mismatch endonuclease (patch repair protein)